MANVNVNRNITDQFYRYKMPKVLAKVEGKGNGIKTVIVNMTDVAKALQRPPTYPTKYFGCELGAQTQFDAKNDRYIVNGSHDSIKLQDLLDGFIRRFVLCPECENPETNLNVLQKKGIIMQRCIACGHSVMLDMRHKLTTFILKNPPDQEPSLGSTTPAKKEKGKRRKGAVKENGSASPEQHEDQERDQRDRPITDLPKAQEDEDDVDWGEDVSDAAVAQRMADLSEAAKKLAVSDDVEKTQAERIDILYMFIKQKKEAKELTNAERQKEVVSEAERLDVKDKATLILVELLYDENILQQIKLYRTLFLRFTHGNQKSQRYLLGGVEQLIGKVHKDALMPKVPHIIKLLYDTDVLEEETIIEWDQKGASKKYVSKEISREIHEKATPFIKWLKEAEEESSDSEGEEEVEVVYSHTDKVGTQTVKETPTTKAAPKEELDFDIDAI